MEEPKRGMPNSVPPGLHQMDLVKLAAENGLSCEKAHEAAWDQLITENRKPSRRVYRRSFEAGLKKWEHRLYLYYREVRKN